MSYGLDKHIDTTIQRLEESLWLPYDTSFKGRSWVIDKKNGNQPFAYLGNNEYKEVLATDLKDALIHFHVESNRPNAGYSTYTANVYIMVAVNLGKIYGSDSRAVERAHKEVTDVINNSPFGRCDLVTDIEAYNIYDLNEKQTKLFNMQPYYVFRLESEITYNANQSCPIEEDQTYDVTTSIVGDGEINSNPETLTGIERNTLVSLNATANTGSRFVNWVYKGLTSVNRIISFYVTENISAIATFIAQWNLTTSVDGNGTITPGDGVYDDGDIVEIVAEPTDPETDVLDRIEVNAVEVANTSPYQLSMIDNNKEVVAYFVALFTIIQDVFGNTPVSNIFQDQSGNNDNVTIQDVQIINPKNEYAVLTGKKIVGGQPINVKFKFKSERNDDSIFSCFDNGGGEKGISIGTWNGGTSLIIWTNNGGTAAYAITSTIMQLGNWYIGEVDWDGVSPTATIKINGTTYGHSGSLKTWSGNSTRDVTILARADLASNWQMMTEYLTITNDSFTGEYLFQEGVDKYIIDSSGYGNHFELQNLGTQFWRNTRNANAVLSERGCSIFVNNLDDTKLLYALYTSLNTPSIDDITGYTKDKEVLSGSVLKNRNRLKWPENNNLSQIAALQNAGFYSYNYNTAPLYRKWDNAIEYTVNASGTGDYATIRDAILAQNGKDFVIINVEAGIYNEQDIQGVDNVWLKGVGKTLVTIISDGLSTDISPANYYNPTYANTAYNLIPTAEKHGFRVEKSMLVTGIKSISNDVKYNVHQDKNGIYESWFIDCDFESHNMYYLIGMGGWSNQIQNYINCTFKYTGTQIDLNQSSIYWHNINTTSVNAPAKLLLDTCISTKNNLLTAQDLDSEEIDVVTIVDCVINEAGKGLRMISTTFNVWVLAVNTTLTFNNNGVVSLKALDLGNGKILYGDTDNFVEGSPYTGATPQIVGFEEIHSLENGTNVEITKDTNSISRLIIKQ